MYKYSFNSEVNISPAYAALATACILEGDREGAERALEGADKACKREKQVQMEAKRASVPLFLKFRTEEIERECKKLREYLSKHKKLSR